MLIRTVSVCLSAVAVALGCVAQPAAPATLSAAAPFPVGAALNPGRLANDARYRETAAREFNSVTAENHLKMHHVHPDKDRYDWSGGDALVTFAQQTGKRLHGHTLLWHEAIPGWVKSFEGDSTAWEALVREHIQTVMRHYEGRIPAWDVVNEVFLDDGTWRPSLWRDKLGPDYVARLFRYARAADPAVKLFYNDYGQEYSPRKLDALLAMVADFKRRGIPIDGIGLQMHTHIDQPIETIENALRRVAATGLLVHISELDVRINPKGAPAFTPTDAHWQRQQAQFTAIARAYRTLVPPAQQYGITTWNVGDGDSWIPKFCKCPDFPLPFDANYAKKPAYAGFLTGLRP